MEPLSPIWVELVKGGGAGLVVCVFVWLALRDFRGEMREQTRILSSLSRKGARTETLLIALFEAWTGKRVKRAQTAPTGYPTTTRSRADSDDPPIAIPRTTSEDLE